MTAHLRDLASLRRFHLNSSENIYTFEYDTIAWLIAI